MQVTMIDTAALHAPHKPATRRLKAKARPRHQDYTRGTKGRGLGTYVTPPGLFNYSFPSVQKEHVIVSSFNSIQVQVLQAENVADLSCNVRYKTYTLSGSCVGVHACVHQS